MGGTSTAARRASRPKARRTARDRTSSWKTGKVEWRTVFNADLSALSPDVEIHRTDTLVTDTLVIVAANTSSGRPDIQRRVVRGGSTGGDERADKLQFLLWDEAVGDSLAHHLADQPPSVPDRARPAREGLVKVPGAHGGRS
jgi:hypothetical protein